MSVKKQKSAVLNQTVFPHDLNNKVTDRFTEFAVLNRNCPFIDTNVIQKYVVMYLTKYGIPKDQVIAAYKASSTVGTTGLAPNDANVITFIWRKRNLRIRIVSEGNSSNLIIKVFAQFFTLGYIMNGYENENQIYELSISHIPSSIISTKVGDNHSAAFTDHVEELNARIEAGIGKRIE